MTSYPIEWKGRSKKIPASGEENGDPIEAQRSGFDGEKEEPRSTAEEKAAASSDCFSEPYGEISDDGAGGGTRTRTPDGNGT